MRNNKTMCWVHPDFKKKLKSEASLNGKTLLQYTEELARKDKPPKKVERMGKHENFFIKI